MGLSYSARVSRIVQAEIRAMSIECEKVNGINLAQGVCDTEVPPAVRGAAQEGIEKGVNSYTRYDGLAELRCTISRKLLEYNGIGANPETDIVVSAGSTGSFYCACIALLNPGDEVILFEPFYGYHVNTLLSVEAVPRYVTLHPPDWTFSLEELRKAITRKTKAIVVNTPANPSGKVFTRTELVQIGDLAAEYDLFIFTDEIYEYFLYDDHIHISPGSLPGMEERTITISGLSKTLSITGWRIGYSASSARWAKMIGYVNDLIYVCAPAPLQHGVAVGLSHLDESFYQDLRVQYTQKRNLLCQALARAGIPAYRPQGAYYVLADVSRLPGTSSKEKAMFLLARTGVASVPGEAFFHNGGGQNFVRFCFAKTDEDLNAACLRLSQFSFREIYPATSSRPLAHAATSSGVFRSSE